MNLFQRITDYLRDSKSELEKVTWPSRQETIRYSSLVLAVCVVVALFFATLDYGLDTLVSAALNRQATQITDQQTQNPAQNPSQTPSVFPGVDVSSSSTTFVPTTINATPVAPAPTVTPTPKPAGAKK